MSTDFNIFVSCKNVFTYLWFSIMPLDFIEGQYKKWPSEEHIRIVWKLQ